MNQHKDFFEEFPQIVKSFTQMNLPNEAIGIYEGKYELYCNDTSVVFEGKIYFEWLPRYGVKFIGVLEDTNFDIISQTQKLYNSDLLSIKANSNIYKECHITNINIGGVITIKGIITGECINGDKQIPVNTINFEIANLRDFLGEIVKDGGYSGRNRIILENDEFIINIDKKRNYSELKSSVEDTGGYFLLYSGEIISKKSEPLLLNENIKETLSCLRAFLTFINGRRCAPVFIRGVYNDEVIWTDYNNLYTETYNQVISWPSKHYIDGINDLWNNFYTIWKGNSDFLSSVIHWYIEANNNAGYAEGSIVLTQTALELIYNWFIIEQKKMLTGKDAENIGAANKIRLLLSQIEVNSKITESLDNLNKFISENNDINDAPDAFVKIRNAIIHSNEDKRKKLSKIDKMVKYEALKVGILFTELSLLYILDYKGIFFNRCANSNRNESWEAYVPWVKAIPIKKADN